MQTKINYSEYFKNKKITKQGFGFLGRGANVVKFLLQEGADVLVTDMKTEFELQKSIKEIGEFLLKTKTDNLPCGKIEYRLGEHRIEDFVNCDYVIQASGVAKDNIYLKAARDAGKKVYQESSLFVEIINQFNKNILNESDNKNILQHSDTIKIIGITGTRGKTTTTFLIKSIIEKYLDYVNQIKFNNNDLLDDNIKNRKVYFGGNVQNVATLENLKNIKSGDVIVMELDSWILQGFADIKYSPHISVFTTFMPDHMNYYKGDMREYFLDKANIFLYQNIEDIFVTTSDIIQNIKKYFININNEKSNFDIEQYITTDHNLSKDHKHNFVLQNDDIENYCQKYKTLLLGDHNKINMSLAIKACEEFLKTENIISDEKTKIIIQETLDNFTGVAGRQEFVCEKNSVKYYNDTTATTPDALMVAIDAFKNKNMTLICGGRDKELDITLLAKKMIDYHKKGIIKNIILLSNQTTNGTDNLKKVFVENNFVEYLEFANIDDAVTGAALRAAPHEIVIFSPGFASFGMFLNEYDRGEKYLEALNNL